MSGTPKKRRNDFDEADEPEHGLAKHSHRHKKKKHKDRKHKYADPESRSSAKTDHSLKSREHLHSVGERSEHKDRTDVYASRYGTDKTEHRERTEFHCGRYGSSGSSVRDKEEYYKSKNISQIKMEHEEGETSSTNYVSSIKSEKNDVDGDLREHHRRSYETKYESYKCQTEIVKSEERTELKVKEEAHSSDSESESELDFNFDFTQYKSDLIKIFFRDQNFIKRGTQEYEDFWLFVVKYLDFQRKKKSKQVKGSHAVQNPPSSGELGLPQRYDNRYRINMSLVSKNVDLFLKKGRLVDYDVDKALTRERVTQFRNIFLHYLDFQQKQKLNKIKKIQKDQRNLPIFQYKQMIVGMIRRHQIVVVAGDTGCGKSTQVPQYLLEGGFENIACTQPRRIACISLSKRVGYETLHEYGSEVAYQVRFEKTKTKATKVIFLTEGLLLRQMSTDPYLKQYNVIVIDEVHERHIFTDFLLGVLKCMLQQRDDLKLVLMSATINISLFSGYFDNAPVIKVPGRLYPIQLEYYPLKQEEQVGKSERMDPTPYIRILQQIDHKYPKTERGDLLVFLSGMSDIMTVIEAVRVYALQTKGWIVLPLHSALSIQEQDQVFDIAPEGVRKCIVSTNIAETSVTIDGVRFIIDSGKVKEMNFDPKCKMQRLQEFWISRASAEQRKGRAGRTGPGICYRLYDETDYDAFQEYATPEIQRVTLDTLILQMISMGLPNARKFPFIEAPEMSSIENSISFLKEQDALTEDESLTPIGHMLSRLPVEVVIGKMLIMGSIFHMIDPVLSIAAAMSVQSPFTVRAHSDNDAIAARKSLESDHGDPFTLLNAFDEWIQVKAEGRGTRKWCKRRGMEEQRFYEMTKLKRQFKDLLEDHRLLDKVDEKERFYTSEERRQRHGERKRLAVLKREQQKESKKRKVLKFVEDDFTISDEEEDDKGDDVKDLEFRLSHDLDQLQETANKSRRFTRRDINLLKVILCSGLYPQVAIADDCNSYKPDSEQAFHTKNKPFILLHPTSVFANHPDVLQPSDIKDSQDHKLKLSSKHELLSYVSILETNKPYLINTMRVPALQTVTLFSNSIDTNTDCSRLVCDGWLEISFPDEESADSVISSIIMLRSTWQNLLKVRLEDTSREFDDKTRINPKSRKLEQVLARKLSEFLDSSVTYSIRRVLAAEMKHMYVGPGHELASCDTQKSFLPSVSGRQEHSVKGGIQVNSYLTYNCLVDDTTADVWGEYTSHMQRHWTCPQCDVSLIVSIVERLQHEIECQSHDKPATKEEEVKELEEERATQLNPLRKPYHCTDCDKDFTFTSTEILKHRKSHKT
ncbi:probable ATP-dependent RNA helicase DHX34 [Gigantopelta aegis]|uniref:probable ATP-dependent RNA helicase DHX34 n=1 Tax=Gigantopelta aegis TaxID=1735272 RepID=UPI001B88A5A5|nr:probable ATP-dependent RNA helicase DHX34 [Gigantopelta aegis]